MHVLSIGSSVIDLFLDIDKNFAKISNGNVELKLGDKIPSQIKQLALGGNGANVSVGLTRLEIPTTFYTYLGKDVLSREIEQRLSSEGVALEAQRHDQKSASLSIIFDFDSDRIIFSHHEVQDYTFEYNKQASFDYIFLTSIGQRWEKAYEQTYEFAQKNNIPMAFSPGTHQLENINGIVLDIVKSSKIYFSNKEEAEKLSNLHPPAGGPTSNIQDLLLAVKKMGPEVVSITDGANGAYAIDSFNNCYFIKPSLSKGIDKTGAGDAYAAGFFAATLHRNDVATAMSWGTLNSAGVIQQVGAQKGLLTKKQLDEKLKENDNLRAETL